MRIVGITGADGFMGTHLKNSLMFLHDDIEVISINREEFNQDESLREMLGKCDVIYHLAAVNRCDDPEELYQQNIHITQKLIDALEIAQAKPHVIFSSSIQEERDNHYGRSKVESRNMLLDWAKRNEAKCSALIIPNTFGPFSKPYYNTFIATFCHQLIHGEKPVVQVDSNVNLIYIHELVDVLIGMASNEKAHGTHVVAPTHEIKVSEVLDKLRYFHEVYVENGEIPVLKEDFDIQLFNTFRSYISLNDYFPKEFTQHSDDRGSFVEIIRLGIGGQCSFSTTHAGVTRGNHFHTRKIERFAVIKGKAKIELRRIDQDEVFSFDLDGEQPAYVDMPIWYTHNITNVGEEDLYTIFWINEAYDPNDPDTYFIEV